MNRLTLFALIGGVAVIEFLSLRACAQAVFPMGKTSPVPEIGNSVVALADGSVMIAAPGTISRDVIDWFNDPKAGPRQFDIGRQPFLPNSDLPAPEAEVRLDRFAEELKANPDVNARIMVCNSAHEAAYQQLAASRARRVTEELTAQMIDASRISTAPCPASAAPGSAPAADQDEQTIRIGLSRGD